MRLGTLLLFTVVLWAATLKTIVSFASSSSQCSSIYYYWDREIKSIEHRMDRTDIALEPERYRWYLQERDMLKAEQKGALQDHGCATDHLQ